MVSVTEILDYFLERPLVDWMVRDPKKAKQVSEEAKRIGSATDLLIQADVRGTPVELPVKDVPVMNCLEGWRKFKVAYPLFTTQIQAMQREISQGEIIGHPDFLMEWSDRPGRWGIVDLKCANQIRPGYWTQVAAYAWLKSPELNPDVLGILRLDKERADFEYVELTDPSEIDYEVQIWLDYKQLYFHRQRVAERRRTQKEDEVLHVS